MTFAPGFSLSVANLRSSAWPADGAVENWGIPKMASAGMAISGTNINKVAIGPLSGDRMRGVPPCTTATLADSARRGPRGPALHCIGRTRAGGGRPLPEGLRGGGDVKPYSLFSQSQLSAMNYCELPACERSGGAWMRRKFQAGSAWGVCRPGCRISDNAFRRGVWSFVGAPWGLAANGKPWKVFCKKFVDGIGRIPRRRRCHRR